jgi:hypothetical protein
MVALFSFLHSPNVWFQPERDAAPIAETLVMHGGFEFHEFHQTPLVYMRKPATNQLSVQIIRRHETRRRSPKLAESSQYVIDSVPSPE